jgi:iron complex transport system substrate-binding protein
MVVALGAQESLVGISHECDWPPIIRGLPRVTATPVDPAQSSAAIHQAVQDAVAAGRSVIGIEAEILRALGPDVIITQVLCDVCAVADGEAMRLADAMTPSPRVVALDGRTLTGVWNDIRTLAVVLDRVGEGEALLGRLGAEVAAIAAQRRIGRPPRVVAIEWLDPLFLAGHWVPDMIAAAGGVDVGARSGDHSTVRSWDELYQLDPDVVLIVLCGFDEARARSELAALQDVAARAWLTARHTVVLDGNAYTSRPGPRLVDGIRLMASAISGR